MEDRGVFVSLDVFSFFVNPTLSNIYVKRVNILHMCWNYYTLYMYTYCTYVSGHQFKVLKIHSVFSSLCNNLVACLYKNMQ